MPDKPSPGSIDAANEFQSRRRRAGRFALPWIVIGALGLLVTDYVSAWASAKELVFFAFFCLIFVGIIIGACIYRCPKCGKVPNEDGVPFNPTICPSCGARLK